MGKNPVSSLSQLLIHMEQNEPRCLSYIEIIIRYLKGFVENFHELEVGNDFLSKTQKE